MITDFVHHPDAPDVFSWLLPAGIWPCTLNEIERKLADDFALSRTRESLFNGLTFYLRDLRALGLSGRIWLDGSFVTGKIDPADVDAILLVSFDAFNRLSNDDQFEALALIRDGQRIKARYDVHAFGTFTFSSFDTSYSDSVDLVTEGLQFFSRTKRFVGHNGELVGLNKGTVQLDFGDDSEIEKVEQWFRIVQRQTS